MADEFESGFMVREPSWHKKEDALLAESPKDWATAKRIAKIDWDVITQPVYAYGPESLSYGEEERPVLNPIKGWQAITRNDKTPADKNWVLGIQKKSYHVITNETFGSVLDAAMGLEADDDPFDFDVLMSLYGGRAIVAVCMFPKPLHIPWDDSKTYRFVSFISRHDGQGGLRILPTNTRDVCANTLSYSEITDGKTSGITIRHTSNWEERVAEVGRGMAIARGEGEKWLKFAADLAAWKVGPRQREAYLKRFLPISDDMGQRKMDNVTVARERVRDILKSETCTHIANSGYGLLMASTEWSDHHRDYISTDSYIARQLLRKEEPKARAARVLRQMARA